MTLSLLDEAQASGARLAPACGVLGLDARTVQRWRARPGADRRKGPNGEPRNKLSTAEREEVRAILVSPGYRDLTPHQIVPRLLDEEQRFVASESTMYRTLREEKLDAHRAASRPATHSRPREHRAEGPGEVLSWDITYLPTQVRGAFFFLYLMMDVWSRKIVGWAVHEAETAEHASRLFRKTCLQEGLDPNGVVLHSDNGSPMKGSTMLVTLERLGVLASFSRPRVSNDNPFSEALFRTLKYRPEYPSKPFATVEAAEAWILSFVRWYNTEHRHSAIRFVTPDERHRGRDSNILQARHELYLEAKRRNPERWSGSTRNWTPIESVTLNPISVQLPDRQAAS